MRKDNGQVFRIEDYRPASYLAPHTQLTFELDAQETIVTASVTFERQAETLTGTPLVLDGDGLELLDLAIDGVALEADEFEASPERLEIKRPPAARQFELTIRTRLDPSANQALMGLYLSNGVYCTQCEAEGFRRITYFPDRPDVLSVYTVRIEAGRASAPLLLSNGNLVEAGDLGNKRHFAVWHDPFPKPSYLFALVAGDLDSLEDDFVTRSGRKVELAIHVEKGKEGRAAYAMDALKRSMRWDEDVFGLEYDLDMFNIVAVPDFNMGAMENKGLNIFNDKYILADADTATDADFANIEAIVAHEYFHNWTGNRVTCRDWFQLCLKEGLTVYRDHEFSAAQRSRAVKRIAEVRALKAHQFPEDQGPLAHPVRPRRYREINNFYTATIYEKGAEVVRMLRIVVGDEAFLAGLRLYFERHDGQAVTIEDFLRAFAEASGKDLAQFALWYHQAGTPNLAASSSYEAEKGEYRLEIEQSVPSTPSESRKRLMHIPLAYGLVGQEGSELTPSDVEGAEIEDGVIHLKKRRHVIRFKGLSERPYLSLNRGFSAPVTLSMERQRDELIFLARHDTDLYARWEALQALVSEALIDATHARKGGKLPAFDDGLTDLAAALAGDDTLEPSFRAQALSLPSENDIAREMGDSIDPDAIFDAREALIKAIGSRHFDAFLAIHDTLSVTGEIFSADAASAGRRALRNVIFDYICAAGADPAFARARFDDATNMTDRAAALSQLVHRFQETGKTRHALAEFEARYRDNPLVLDKWFQIQASTPGPHGLNKVRNLMRHESFTLSNPNRVRALIGTFASLNQTGFHRADGGGYKFFADVIVEIDANNPQLAARLATAFRSWRSLESGRREKARLTLLDIAAQKELSTDLRDIIERTLV